MEDVVMRVDDLPLPKVHSGKVGETFDTSSFIPGTQLEVRTDRISVKDCPLLTGIPGKGKVLTGISAAMFREMEANGICPTHFIADDIAGFPPELINVLDPYKKILTGRAMLVRSARVLEFEFIPRSRMYGTARDSYLESGCKSIFGIPVPGNLKEGDRLPATFFTLSTKAPAGQHDENITYPDFIGRVGLPLAQQVRGMCLSIYEMMQIIAAQCGFEYADTKIELGWKFIPGIGWVLMALDELGTPDSSRTIPSAMTKQPVRDYLARQGFTGDEPVALPDRVVEETSRNYYLMYTKVTGRKIA